MSDTPTSIPSTPASGAGRWILVAAAGALLVGLVAGPVLAGAMAPRSSGAAGLAAGTSDTPPEHTISVAGSGKVVVVPDQATVTLGVVIERDSAKAARAAAAETMTRVVAAIKALGIDEKDIATANVSLSPVYNYPNNQAPVLRGYQLNNSVTVTVRDLDKLSDVLDEGIRAGATSVDGVSFDVSDRAAAEAKARQAAVADAKAKADTLATGLSVRIDGVSAVSEQVSTPVWYDRMNLAAPAAAEDGAAQTPVLPGTTDVVITVQVTFLIP